MWCGNYKWLLALGLLHTDGAARSLAGAGVGLGPLAAHRQALVVTDAAVAVDLLKALEIPVPPLAEQRRIAGILDRFEVLVDSLTDGLPAELQARRQQYEYYRGRLLTFAEAAA